ncbi:RT0821/Lpp0805 family surface protein [Aquabacter cavernae]|uniref:RT0821/Lpp0805 family surface protein n=1 Tax=Aquabacter cavernae TaxID=2496029 RepID=UPI0013DFA401|nr:RT0821/Lpp0805 family surface protein [Aquabacter cavernae]
MLAAIWALAGCGALRLGEPADPMITGSIKVQPASLPVPSGEAPSGIAAGDWAQAKLALDQALASPDKAASIPWDNPKTGARGTATPIGTAGADGCREFRIGVVGTGGEQWVQGAACKDGKGAVMLSQVRVLGRA